MELPLAGLTIINTRPEDQQAELTAQLESRGASVIKVPALEIRLEPPDAVAAFLSRIKPSDILLLTSRNACHAMKQALLSSPGTASLALAADTACVGGATAELARSIGLRVEVVADEWNWEGLHKKIIEHYRTNRPRVFALHGSSTGGALQQALREDGFGLELMAVYRSTGRQLAPKEFQALAAAFAADPCIVVLSSPAGVRAFAEQVKSDASCRAAAAKGLSAAALGSKTAGVARQAGFDVAVCAANSGLSALVSEIEEFYKSL